MGRDEYLYRSLTGRNRKVLSQNFWVAIEFMACCSPRLVQFTGEEDVNRAHSPSMINLTEKDHVKQCYI
ncbi:hypothetical protein TNCV_5042101 [Trichonephila clavipes]|uniref:Uncharacterized protein n=1 Tax=Trichonephila clavipes TaxID=2585209 RepID=A0A8X6R4L1_TRICX|nr:hypothetical protein TNCV_5042101 [Trichonephila clavipes]